MRISTIKKGLFGAVLATAAMTMAAFTSAPTVGSKAPDFELKDLNGNAHTLSGILAKDDTKAVVLEWYNPECPYVVVHYSEENQTMNKVAEKYASEGVVWLRINSGAEGKQGAGLQKNKDFAKKYMIDGPILLDESGKVGKAYNAKRTPEMFIIGKDSKIHYHGSMESARSTREVGEDIYVEQALQQVLRGETVTVKGKDPRGCSVKYAN